MFPARAQTSPVLRPFLLSNPTLRCNEARISSMNCSLDRYYPLSHPQPLRASANLPERSLYLLPGRTPAHLPVVLPLGLDEPALDACSPVWMASCSRAAAMSSPSATAASPTRWSITSTPTATGWSSAWSKKRSPAGKPFLGICRGLQVINIALGGSLYEDILDQKPGSLRTALPTSCHATTWRTP